MKILVRLKWPQLFTSVCHVLKMTIIGIQGMVVVGSTLRYLSRAAKKKKIYIYMYIYIQAMCAEQSECVKNKIKFCIPCM